MRVPAAAWIGLVAAVGAATVWIGSDGPADPVRYALATHVLDGRIPYRSLLSRVPPGDYALDALLLTVFGRTLRTQAIADLVAGRIVYPLLTYAAALQLVRRRGLAVAAALTVALVIGPVPGVRLAPALVSLVMTARWVTTGAPSALAGAGVAAGAGALFGLGAAVSALGASAVTIGVRSLAAVRPERGTARTPALGPLVALGAGTLLGFAPFATALALDGGLGTYLRYASEIPGRVLGDAGFPAALRFAAPIALLPPLLVVAVRLSRDETMRARALIVVLLTSSAIGRMAGGPELAVVLADMPLLVCVLVDWALQARWRIALPRFGVSFALALGVLASAGWRLSADVPAAAFLPFAAVPFAARVPTGGGARGLRVSALLVAFAAAAGAVAVSSPSGARRSRELDAERDRAAAALRASGEVVFAYPSAGFVYEPSGRRNPTSFADLDGSARPWEVRRAIAELERDLPDGVLVRYRQAGIWSDRLEPITDWLEARYVQTERLTTPELWAVWRPRRTGEERCRRLVLHAPDGTSPTRTSSDGERAVLVQSVPEARFRGEAGATLRFGAEPGSDSPREERRVDALVDGRRFELWRGVADGLPNEVVLPPGTGSIVLRSPRGLTTLWTDPEACILDR